MLSSEERAHEIELPELETLHENTKLGYQTYGTREENIVVSKKGGEPYQ